MRTLQLLVLLVGCAHGSSLQKAPYFGDEGRLLQEAGSGSPPPPPPPYPLSPPGHPGAAIYVEHSTLVTMVAAGSVAEFTTERNEGIRRVFASDTGAPLSAVSVTISSGSVVIQIKIILDTRVAADAASDSLEGKLATPEASSAFLASVPGGAITVLSAPVVVAVEESKVMYPSPPPPPPSSPPSPPSPPQNDAMDGGAIAGAVIGSLIGAVFIVAGVMYAMKGGGSSGYSKDDAAVGVTFTNAGPNHQENV